MKTRLLALAVLAVALVPGCAGLTSAGKFVGLIRPPEFVLPETIPPDFRLVVSRRDATDPPIDYEVDFQRSGKVRLEAVSRESHRRRIDHEFEITEDQVVSLWKSVVAARFDQLDDRYPDEGTGRDTGLGVLKVFVVADGLEKAVQSHCQPQGALDSIRNAAYTMVPKDRFAAGREYLQPGATPTDYVVDTSAKRFHRPECAAVKDLPEQRRQKFASPYDALNFGFEPCPDCQPLRSR